MSELVEMFSFWRDSELLKGNQLAPFLGEVHLDSKGSLDIYYLRDLLKTNVTKAQVSSTFYEVFGYSLPSKFLFTKEKTTLTKEEFLIAYEPAAYLNVRSWITYFMFEYGHSLTREDLFNWILSTNKPKIYLGDLYAE